MADIDKINLNNTVYDIVSKIAKGIVRVTIDDTMISLETGFVRVMVIQDYVSENDGSCIICYLDSTVNLSSYVGNSFKFCTGISSTTPGVIDYHEKPVNLSNNKSSDLIASIWNKEREFIFVFSTEQDAWVMQLGNSEIGDAYSSHAEGYNTEATGNSAHAEGQYTRAIGQSSHAEGRFTTASSDGSHAEGYYTKASSSDQHVSGKCNIEDTNGTYVEIIGNGTNSDSRSNARTLDWNGNEEIAGNLRFMESSNTGSTIPGIMWKELGYGDKFEIRPRFAGVGQNNYLAIDAATGDAGTDPQVSTVLEIHPNGGEILYGPAPTRNFKSTTIDMSKADNNVSSNTYIGSYYQDIAFRAYAKITPVILPGGASILEMYAQNFDTSGAGVGANTMQLSMDKSGNAGAYFSHPWALLEALGQYGGMKTGYIVWKNNCFIRQCGGDWSCFMLVDNSLYSICGGGGNHATMTPTLKLLAGDNMSVTQSITHNTNYSDFKYTSTSNHRWAVLSFSNNHNNHGIYYS